MSELDLTSDLLDRLEHEAGTTKVVAWCAAGQFEVCNSATHDVILALVEAARERDQLLRQVSIARPRIEELENLVANLRRPR